MYYKLFKIALVMLAFAVYTSAHQKSSYCKCRHVDTGKPDNDPTKRCCPDDFFAIKQRYGCKAGTRYSYMHHRCECIDESMYNNRDQWSTCCNKEASEPDQGYDCDLFGG